MKKALLVGINAYPGNELDGCINDVVDMAKFLNADYGFDANDIRLITDSRATRQNIIDRLGWLLSGIRAGDTVVFQFSGHGIQYADRNAQGVVDRMFEAICPYDFNWDVDGFNAIRDQDFNRIFSAIPDGVEFIWISDSCHAGGLVRAFAMNGPRHKVRTMRVPADIAWRSQQAIAGIIRPMGIRGVAATLNLALLAACMPQEEAADTAFNGKPNGAFTYYLLQQLNTAPGRAAVLTRLGSHVANSLAAGGYGQHPQVVGKQEICDRNFLNI